MSPKKHSHQLQQFIGVALMTGGLIVGLLCVVILGASLTQPLSAESYALWTVLLVGCLAAMGISLILRRRSRKSAPHDE